MFLCLVAPVVTEDPVAVNVTSIEGTVVLRCGGFGFPFPVITWYQNGSLVEENGNRTIVSTASSADLNVSSVLTIVRPMLNNSGDYHCNLTSSVMEYQEAMSEVVLVLVQSKQSASC